MKWHAREHMPERLSITGFRTGKRLINRYRYDTIYTGEHLEVFRSPAYLERLNASTPWSTGIAPSFRNFLRVACTRLAWLALAVAEPSPSSASISMGATARAGQATALRR